MRKTTLYGVLVAGVITGAVILSADFVFAAPEDEIDYSFVSVRDSSVVLNCPNQNQPTVPVSLEYSEKTTSDLHGILGSIVIEDQFGVVSSGFVTKDNFAVRGIIYNLLEECGLNDANNPAVITLVGNCSLDEESTLTTDNGVTATFGRVACS